MIRRIGITDDDARKAIEIGEFDDSIIGSGERVAIILTQDWCPQWSAVKRWLRKAEKDKSTDEPDVDVYELEYNRKPYGKEFMHFKEDTFGNDLVPYVRYYRDGKLIAESNFVPRAAFFAKFDE